MTGISTIDLSLIIYIIGDKSVAILSLIIYINRDGGNDAMNNNPTALMQNRINEATYGTAFVLSDFTDLADYEAVKKAIARMEKKGLIRRVCRGVYDKPKFSNLLQEYASLVPTPLCMDCCRSYVPSPSDVILCRCACQQP